MRNLDEFTQAYVECALWSTNDKSDPSGGVSLDDNYGPEDINPATLVVMQWHCTQFQIDNWDDLENNHSQAGHDFWLTRNGHSAGFGDGNWPEPAAERLTEASVRFGKFNLYVGDSGKPQ